MLLRIPASIRLTGVLDSYKKKGRVSHTCFVCGQDTSAALSHTENGENGNQYYKLGTKSVCIPCVQKVLRHSSLKKYEYVHTQMINKEAFYRDTLAILKDADFLAGIKEVNAEPALSH